MATHDANSAECLVYTYRDGFLSKLAHNLKLKVKSFEVVTSESNVEATFDAGSLEVVCARENETDLPDELSADDKLKIHENIAKSLKIKKYPEIRFVSSSVERADRELRIRGELKLHGQTRTINATACADGDDWVSEVMLHQPDYAIKPHSFALGALKVKPDVKVVIRVPV